VLGEKSVADPDVALRRSSNNYCLTLISVIINLASWRSAEYFQLQLAFAIVVVNVETLLEMDLLLLLLVMGRLNVLLDVGVHWKERSCDDVHHDVGLANVDQHVVFQHLCNSKDEYFGYLQLVLLVWRKRRSQPLGLWWNSYRSSGRTGSGSGVRGATQQSAGFCSEWRSR